jgi:hypothetical protein
MEWPPMRFDEGGIARLVGGHGRTLPRKLHDTGRPHLQKRFIGQVCEAFFESIAPDHYANSRGQILSGRLNPTQSASVIHWSGMVTADVKLDLQWRAATLARRVVPEITGVRLHGRCKRKQIFYRDHGVA